MGGQIDFNKKCCTCRCPNSCDYCRDRTFQKCVGKLANILNQIKLQEYGKPIDSTLTNPEEIQYKHYHYNASFHKGLQHNLRDGRLVCPRTYEQLKYSIVCDDQKLLNDVEMARGCELQFVSPLSSLASLLIGVTQGTLDVPPPPTLSSDTAAAEMVELYAQALARDIPFINYECDEIIEQLLGCCYLNKPNVLNNLEYIPASRNCPFTPQTIFRGGSYGDTLGPYISQLLLLNMICGGLHYKQKYYVPPKACKAQHLGIRVEWGVNLKETIDLQNGTLELLPPPTPQEFLRPKYLYSGRSLAEAVHGEPVYQFYFQAAILLAKLGARPNPDWPHYSNQINYLTANGRSSLQCAIAEVTDYAMKHVWYWKWQQYRKLRPETFGLWTHDVKTGLVPNEGNFDISDILLDNEILTDIVAYNSAWTNGEISYTLPQAYHEAAPLHPSYASGHATIAGACATILKIYFDGEQPWLELPGVISGELTGIPNALVQANHNGKKLIKYDGEVDDITVGTEINKLATNIPMGRNWAGIHYRSDAIQGIMLGEQVAMAFMQDLLSTMVENNANGQIPCITFRKFDGSCVTIKPTICQ